MTVAAGWIVMRQGCPIRKVRVVHRQAVGLTGDATLLALQAGQVAHWCAADILLQLGPTAGPALQPYIAQTWLLFIWHPMAAQTPVKVQQIDSDKKTGSCTIGHSSSTTSALM